jgi:hypothetical protein
LDHFKDKGHVWVIALSVLTLGAFLFLAIGAHQNEERLIANAVLALVAASTLYGGGIALIVLALLNKTQCGELAEFRSGLALGLLVSISLSGIKLVELFRQAMQPLNL